MKEATHGDTACASPSPRPCLASAQVLREAKSQLEAVVERRFDEAVASRDSATAVRFAKLYKPLGKQVRPGVTPMRGRVRSGHDPCGPTRVPNHVPMRPPSYGTRA